jgi:NAD(P)H-hydrate epimerase
VILIPLPETKSGTLSLKGEPKILAQLKNKDVLCLGPGLSQEEETVDLVRKILNQTSLPTVLDADGLNAISNLNQLAHLKGQLIITPHLGEMSRLIKREIKFIQENKIAVAREVAGKLKAVVVLKGAHSVIAQPNGEIYLNPTGNPGLASAGVGDVLTGLIAGLVGQRFSLIQSALTGTYLHGLAGDEVAREKGEFSLRATDLLRKIPLCLKKLTSSA